MSDASVLEPVQPSPGLKPRTYSYGVNREHFKGVPTKCGAAFSTVPLVDQIFFFEMGI